MVALLERVSAGRSARGLPGTVTRSSRGASVVGPQRPFMSVQELETLPFPAWDEKLIGTYRDAFLVTARRPFATVLTSRGCSHNCAFCSSPSIWGGVRQRSVRSVIDEVDWLVDRFGVRYLVFEDDVFGLTTEWVLDFCDYMMRLHPRLRWMCVLHPLAFRNRREETYRAMARAGLDFISFGAQSADQDVLRGVNRSPSEPEHIRESVRLCNNLGIATALTYIFGLPGDSPQTVEKTIRFVIEAGPTFADFHLLEYLDGSALNARYPEGNAVPYDIQELVQWTSAAFRRFYLDPRTWFRLISFILANNPAHLLQMPGLVVRALPAFLAGR